MPAVTRMRKTQTAISRRGVGFIHQRMKRTAGFCASWRGAWSSMRREATEPRWDGQRVSNVEPASRRLWGDETEEKVEAASCRLFTTPGSSQDFQKRVSFRAERS